MLGVYSLSSDRLNRVFFSFAFVYFGKRTFFLSPAYRVAALFFSRLNNDDNDDDIIFMLQAMFRVGTGLFSRRVAWK